MRILKYILLLFLLFLIGLTVFIITQKGDYKITRSAIIKTPRATVYNYVNDYKNWENFASWSDAKGKTQFTFPKNTIGKNASFSWNGNSSGTIKTTEVIENVFIKQKMIFNETETEGYWTFKDTLGKTKVSWHTKGTMGVIMKLKAFVNGGIANTIGSIYEKTLTNLDRTLDFELNTFDLKVDGIVVKPKQFYIAQTINSKNENVTKNIKIMIPKMIAFFEKNDMVMHGKPFVMINKTDDVAKTTNFSVCMPVKDSVYISPVSDVSSGKIDAISVVKTTLKGDYSHLPKANQKVLDYLFENKIKRNFAVAPYQVYVFSFIDDKRPSKWKTELYYPVHPNVTPVAP